MRNKIQEAFDQVEADSRLKESTKQFLRQERGKKISLFGRPAVKRVLAAACMVFALALGLGGYSWIQTPVSYVSIDINPSIELALNRFDRVVTAVSFNAEGEEILKELSLKGKTYQAAIDAIMESRALEPYLAGRDELVFTVAAEKGKEKKLLQEAEHCSRHAGQGSIGIRADLELVAAAHDCGLSLGKYYAYLKLAKYDETVTPESCKDMSMSRIHGLIEEHEHGNNHGRPSEESGPGEGGHHGGASEAEPEESGGSQEPEGAGQGQGESGSGGGGHHGGASEAEPEESGGSQEPDSGEGRGHHGHGGRH